MQQNEIYQFLQSLNWHNIPNQVQEHSRLLLLDLLGVAAAGTGTELHGAVSRYANRNLRGEVPVLFSDANLSPEGAALVGGMTIDAIDAHDGHRLTKGHVGCGLLPALLAVVEDSTVEITGEDFLALLIAGYEIGSRSGIALHQTAPDYHTSGAWNALTAAALTAHLLELSAEQFDHALGIAEYHGPRSQMMRVIDHPTMLKDGSGWGALSGVSAGYLAAEGFTGAPAITVLNESVTDVWQTLGHEWEVMNQYLKAFPVCRWAQPAVQAALDMKADHGFESEDIESVSVTTFTEGTRLWKGIPQDTEQAQYAIGLPVAAALVRSQVGLQEITEPAFGDPALLRVLKVTQFNPSAAYDAKFPKERWADISVTLASGEVLQGPETTAKGDPETQLSAEEIIAKFYTLGEACYSEKRLDAIKTAVMELDATRQSFDALKEVIYGAS